MIHINFQCRTNSMTKPAHASDSMIGPHNIQLHTHLGIVRCFWSQHSTHPSKMLTFETHVAYGQSTQMMLISLHDMFTQSTPFQELHVTALVDFTKNQILGSSSFIPMNTNHHDILHAKMSALCMYNPPTTKDATTQCNIPQPIWENTQPNSFTFSPDGEILI